MHPDFEPAILASTMFVLETWKVPYDADSKTFGEAEVIYSGVANETAVPLEFYGAEDKLHISHALPIVVKGYELAALPELVFSGPDIVADPGAHHMIFFHLGLGP
ncbi:hypothetical protein [Ruegeria arenilitoris]|uniref:hypothetical protein n=1 Tax=Ruegeria arenilitoris TaxID=1173585 RepID=UPI00158028BC|nr:hypothetical protein [Ruegeria arenilitoris]